MTDDNLQCEETISGFSRKQHLTKFLIDSIWISRLYSHRGALKQLNFLFLYIRDCLTIPLSMKDDDWNYFGHMADRWLLFITSRVVRLIESPVRSGGKWKSVVIIERLRTVSCPKWFWVDCIYGCPEEKGLTWTQSYGLKNLNLSDLGHGVCFNFEQLQVISVILPSAST